MVANCKSSRCPCRSRSSSSNRSRKNAAVGERAAEVTDDIEATYITEAPNVVPLPDAPNTETEHSLVAAAAVAAMAKAAADVFFGEDQHSPQTMRT